MEDTSVCQTSVKKIRLDNVDTEGNCVNNGVTYLEVDIIQWAGAGLGSIAETQL